MSIRQNRWLILCAVIALVSVSVNVYLLSGSTAVTGDDSKSVPSPRSAVQAAPPDETIAVATSMTPELREMLRELQQSMKATQEQVEMLALRMPAKPEKAQPSAEEIARREARREEVRERLMLDVPEDQRPMLYHERWLRENREEVEELAREVENLKHLSEGSISN